MTDEFKTLKKFDAGKAAKVFSIRCPPWKEQGIGKIRGSDKHSHRARIGIAKL